MYVSRNLHNSSVEKMQNLLSPIRPSHPKNQRIRCVKTSELNLTKVRALRNFISVKQ